MRRLRAGAAIAALFAGAVAAVACGGPRSSSPAAFEEPSERDDEPPAPPSSDGSSASAPGAGDPAPAPPAGSVDSPAPGAALSADARAILAAHNSHRANHCARPLVWSADLASTAQAWASSLRASGCAFEHSQTAYGENLAAGTSLSGEGATELWYREAKMYDYRRQGFSMETGHFTQLVWVGTRAIGCGSSECQGMRIWVCHYDPPGNVLSLFADNVLPPTCR